MVPAAPISSSRALAFLNTCPHTQVIFLNSSFIACPGFHLLIVVLWLPSVTHPCPCAAPLPHTCPQGPHHQTLHRTGCVWGGDASSTTSAHARPQCPSSAALLLLQPSSAQPQPSPSYVPCTGSQAALLGALPRSGQGRRLGQGWLFPQHRHQDQQQEGDGHRAQPPRTGGVTRAGNG